MPISYYHIDSFASELFAGNPAGVCLLPAFPVNDVMQKIAAENRHSETAFVVAREQFVREGIDVVIRNWHAHQSTTEQKPLTGRLVGTV